MTSNSYHRRMQKGATLIEVLVAVLIMSFGLLSLGAMLSYSVQLPKLSAHKTIASNIASDHIERIRANPAEFIAGTYASASNYDGTFNALSLADCTFPNCTSASLAAMDTAATQFAARSLLPAGGIVVSCDANNCGAANAFGNIWIIWQEPSTNAVLSGASSDYCPPAITGATWSPVPRCLYVRFKI